MPAFFICITTVILPVTCNFLQTFPKRSHYTTIFLRLPPHCKIFPFAGKPPAVFSPDLSSRAIDSRDVPVVAAVEGPLQPLQGRKRPGRLRQAAVIQHQGVKGCPAQSRDGLQRSDAPRWWQDNRPRKSSAAHRRRKWTAPWRHGSRLWPPPSWRAGHHRQCRYREPPKHPLPAFAAPGRLRCRC